MPKGRSLFAASQKANLDKASKKERNMKRTLLTAAFAALALGAAQALTAGWNIVGLGSEKGFLDLDGSSFADNTQTCWANTVATYAATVHVGGTVGTGTVFQTGNNSSSATANSIKLSVVDDNGTKKWQVTYNNGTALTLDAGFTNTVTANTDYVVAFGIDRKGGNSITVSINGTTVATVTSPSFSGPVGTLAWGRDVNTDANGFSATYDVFINGGNSVLSDPIDPGTIVADVASLPEPTALALLALGVASVALRRRAA